MLVDDVLFETDNHKFYWWPIKVSLKCPTRPVSCLVNIEPGITNALIRENNYLQAWELYREILLYTVIIKT